jgi:hypothetical protein
MAETRTYNYGGAAPSWQEITLSQFNAFSSVQSYTSVTTAEQVQSVPDSDGALFYISSNYPASNYRGNRVHKIDFLVFQGQFPDIFLVDSGTYYFQRIHSDVVTSTFNGQPVHRVVRQTAPRTGTMSAGSDRISSLSSLSGIEVGMTVIDLTGQIPTGTVVTAISPNLTVNFIPSGAPGTTINVNVSFSSTSFQRQLNFGRTVDMATQVSRTSSSLTWSLINSDQAGVSADILANVTTSSTVINPTTTRATNVAGNGGSVTFTATLLSPSTTYYLNTKTSKPGDSILDSEVWNESWSTFSSVTETPSITDFSLFDLGDGTFQFNYRVRNNDASTAVIRSDVSITPPDTIRGSIGTGLKTNTIIGFASQNETLTIYATATASGKSVSAVRSYTFTAISSSGGGGGGLIVES